MLLTLISQGKIHTSSLPEEPSGMVWVSEQGGFGAKRYGLIEAKDDAWVLSPKKGMQLLDAEGAELDSVVLDDSQVAAFHLGTPETDTRATLLVRKGTPGDKQYKIIGFKTDEKITIGSAANNSLIYWAPFVSPEHARIDYYRDVFFVTRNDSGYGTYVNGALLEASEQRELKAGDTIEIPGLIIEIGHRFISCNNPSFAVSMQENDNFVFFTPPAYTPPEQVAEDEEETENYFYPAPRFKRDIESRSFTVDAPPPPEKPDETPVAMKIGPSMVMSLAGVFSAVVMFTTMMDRGSESEGGVPIIRMLPPLVMAFSMICGAVLWPILSKRFQDRKTKRDEVKRKAVYATYLDSFRIRLEEETELQHEILTENRVPVSECIRRAVTHDPQLMDRTPAHDDFLELRVGIGTVDLAADIRYPDERFSLEKDDLAEVVYALSREPREVVDAPVAVSLIENSVVGIAGPKEMTHPFVFGLIAQIAALHSFEDVKMVLLLDEKDKDTWRWVSNLPHLFDDSHTARFSATKLEEASEIGLMLERIAEERRASSSKTEPIPHYVVVVPSKHMADKAELVNSLARRPAPGMTIITLGESTKDLPKQTSIIIELGEEQASLRSKDDNSASAHRFMPDIALDPKDGSNLCAALNSITLDLAEARSALPSSLGFLESFEAGNLEQLSVKSRWAQKLGSTTLQAQVGVDPQGEPFYLNLHEKFHGPHGLIAGTTGSGKSEFIITWILSMCINYSPEDAAFVLIDYKGGGLAGAFDNDRVRLPHLAGTITNLDGAAINRSLVSIKSELKRRQALFNEAREVAGGDNIDIYKYLELFHQGMVTDPCPHLFIVADEFAELKQQEPEFMSELISAARIGRSLGVHLVLATQKPSGVVNDQIWSNSKFKICLKVADKADSNEMIKRPDAAEIVEAGRFYLLVGYNEYFAYGQSAYTGTPYVAQEQYLPPKDDNVILISNTGRALASAKPSSGSASAEKPSPEIVAVLAHLAEVATSEQIFANQLWLDPIPLHITVDGLEEKYPEEVAAADADPINMNPIVGELDDPENQEQRLLTLPLLAEGNAVVYGSTGSGKETFASTVLVSLLKHHSAETFSAYVMDFGSETMRAFAKAPQVGGVCTIDEEEKVSRLFDFLEKEVKRRSRILGSFGGDYVRYASEHKDMPSILVILNEIAPFADIFGMDYEQRLVSLTRECVRCGIRFLITASAPNDVRMRLRQNFGITMCLPLNDEGDYISILGSMRGVVPPKSYGRGLVKLSKTIYEFQTAYAAPEDEDDFTAIRNLCANLSAQAETEADAIPTLPEKVMPKTLSGYLKNLKSVPVGISHKSLEPVCIDMTEALITRVAAKALDTTAPFVRGLVELLSQMNLDITVLDASKKLDGIAEGVTYIDDFSEAATVLEELTKIRAASGSNEKQKICIVYDIANLMNGFPESPQLNTAINSTMASQSVQDGVHYVFVSTGMQAKDYLNKSYCMSHVSKDNGIWVGDHLKNFTQVFDPGFSNVSKLPKASADEGFTIVYQEPMYTKYVYIGGEEE